MFKLLYKRKTPDDALLTVVKERDCLRRLCWSAENVKDRLCVKLVRRKCLSGVFASGRVSKFAGWES